MYTSFIGVQDAVGNLVGHLVGVAFGNGFGCEEKVARHDVNKLLGLRVAAAFAKPFCKATGRSLANALAVFFNVALQVARLTRRQVAHSTYLRFHAFAVSPCIRMAVGVVARRGCGAGLAELAAFSHLPQALCAKRRAGGLRLRAGARRRGACRPHGVRDAAPVVRPSTREIS